MREPFIFAGSASPANATSCYSYSGEAGVLVTASALMTRVQLVVERFTSLAHFQVLVEQGVVDALAREFAELHFLMRCTRGQPLDVILPAVEVGPKRGSA